MASFLILLVLDGIAHETHGTAHQTSPITHGLIYVLLFFSLSESRKYVQIFNIGTYPAPLGLHGLLWEEKQNILIDG